jgi:hypothetical protein
MAVFYPHLAKKAVFMPVFDPFYTGDSQLCMEHVPSVFCNFVGISKALRVLNLFLSSFLSPVFRKSGRCSDVIPRIAERQAPPGFPQYVNVKT